MQEKIYLVKSTGLSWGDIGQMDDFEIIERARKQAQQKAR